MATNTDSHARAPPLCITTFDMGRTRKRVGNASWGRYGRPGRCESDAPTAQPQLCRVFLVCGKIQFAVLLELGMGPSMSLRLADRKRRNPPLTAREIHNPCARDASAGLARRGRCRQDGGARVVLATHATSTVRQAASAHSV